MAAVRRSDAARLGCAGRGPRCSWRGGGLGCSATIACCVVHPTATRTRSCRRSAGGAGAAPWHWRAGGSKGDWGPPRAGWLLLLLPPPPHACFACNRLVRQGRAAPGTHLCLAGGVSREPRCDRRRRAPGHPAAVRGAPSGALALQCCSARAGTAASGSPCNAHVAPPPPPAAAPAQGVGLARHAGTPQHCGMQGCHPLPPPARAGPRVAAVSG